MTPHSTSESPPPKQARERMRAVVAALRAGHPEDAVREFMAVVSAGSMPRDQELLQWLVSTLGKSATQSLADAFVHCRCFYCSKGRMDCEACDSRGWTEDGAPCDQCFGTRLERCDFCNGSGWVTINYVPIGLQPLVIKGRGSLALRRMVHVFESGPPVVNASEPEAAIREAELLLLNIDRQLGVFENMLLASRSLPPHWPQARSAVEPVIKRCVALAAKAEPRIRGLAHVLAEAHHCLAKAAQGSGKHQHLLRRATFYESLADGRRSLVGTGLMHQFLPDEIQKLAVRHDQPPEIPQ